MIKVFECFSGYGGWSFGLKKIGIDYEVIGISEIDKWAIQCFNQNFPNIKNYGDIIRINPEEIPDFDLLCASPPCFTEETLVITKRGTIPIVEVKVGDYVLTHKNRFRKVLKTGSKIVNE